ncbi:MAG: DUF4143 domain-containing protein [Spirochaetes bacterium]|nr:DUF4143 domain-containing protein [Spirochaetota bacterium]MBN2770148.1 DUF4143 domain-containing protein [Spirochaetota bacterium]
MTSAICTPIIIIFENLVITEILKTRYNNVKTNNISFYRDAKGHEVDLLYAVADKNITVEIKAAATFREDFFSGLDYFDQAISPAIKKIVVYDVDRDEERSRGIVTNFNNIRERLIADEL